MNTRSHYLIGSAGYPNFGDEFIAAAWLRYLADVDPDTDVWLDSPDPGNAQHLFAGLHPRLRVTNTLWRLMGEHSSLPPEEAADRIGALIRNFGSPRYDLGLMQVREASSLHLIGGGYINGIWPQHLGLVAAMKAVRSVTGARLYATGQGLLPVAEGLPDPRSLFEGFDYAAARDHQSAEAFGLPARLDDAFLAASDAVSAAAPGAPSGLMVCIQSDLAAPGRLEEIIATVRPMVRQAVEDGREVRYLEAIPGVDYAAYEQLADLIPEDNFLPFSHVWRHGLPVGPNQQWITTRFHLHLLAAAAGARGIALSVRPGYYDVKHGSLAAIGSGWTLEDGGPLQMPVRRGPLAGNLAALTADKRAEADALYSRRSTVDADSEADSGASSLWRRARTVLGR